MITWTYLIIQRRARRHIPYPLWSPEGNDLGQGSALDQIQDPKTSIHKGNDACKVEENLGGPDKER